MAHPSALHRQARARASARRLDRLLPKGRADFFRQVVIWLGFIIGYEIARGLADRGAAEAFRNAHHVIRIEAHLGGLLELDLQRAVLGAGSVLLHAVNWTYWIAQFLVVTAALLWIYLRRNDAYLQVRNTVIWTNTLGLVLYGAVRPRPRVCCLRTASSTRWPARTRSTTARRSSSSSRTRTPPCRACTQATR